MILIKDFFQKLIEIDFNIGDVCSDAGLLFILQYERKFGIIEGFDWICSTHKLQYLMRQRVFQIIS